MEKFYNTLKTGKGLKDYTYIVPKAYWTVKFYDFCL